MPINKSFGSFVDKKKRDSLKELKLVEKLLKRQGLRVENHLEDSDNDDPYLFCYNPIKEGSFRGIRIYKIADNIAFRVQKENTTHPYGRAYPLPIKEMFEDFLEDEDTSEEKAGKKVIEAVVNEIRRFFKQSVQAEKDDHKSSIDTDKGDAIAVRQQGTDYSSLIYSKA